MSSRNAFQGPLHAHGALLKRTSFGAVLFDGLRAFALEMYETTGHRPAIEDAYSYFKLLERFTQPLKDMEEYDVGVKRHLVALTADHRAAVYRFPAGDWGAWSPLGMNVARTATTLADGRKGYFLIDEQGRIAPFDAERSALGKPLEQIWDADLVNVALDETGRPVLLGRDGRLRLRANGGDSEWSPGRDFSWSNIVNVPLYDAFVVAP